MAHPPELKKRAKELRKQGLYMKVIAVEIGVPETTVTRWLNPELEKRERAKARKRKFSEKRKCPQCKTRRVSNNRKLCQRCHFENRRFWTAEKVVEAIQEWAVEHGFPPSSTEWQASGPGHPAISSILDGPNPPFKKWSEALIAAGFTPHVRRKTAVRKRMPEEVKKRRAELRRKIREDKIRMALEKENKK